MFNLISLFQNVLYSPPINIDDDQNASSSSEMGSDEDWIEIQKDLKLNKLNIHEDPQHIRQLQVLNLSGQEITDQTIDHYDAILKDNNELSNIYLNFTSISAHSIPKIISWFKNNPAFDTLSLQGLDAKCTQALLNGLLEEKYPHGYSPKTLDVSYSALNNAGLKVLSKLIVNTMRINRLALAFCKINVIGNDLFLELKGNTSIHELNLHGNPIGLEGIQQLEYVLNRRPDLNIHINNQGSQDIPLSTREAILTAQRKLLYLHKNLKCDAKTYSHNEYHGDLRAFGLPPIYPEVPTPGTALIQPDILDLENAKLNDKEIDKLSTLYKNNNEFSSIYLGYNTFSTAKIPTIIDWVENKSHFDTLSVQGLNAFDMRELFNKITLRAKNTPIRINTLDLSYGTIDLPNKTKIQALDELLKLKGPRALDELDVSYSSLDSNLHQDITELLFLDELFRSKGLKALDELKVPYDVTNRDNKKKILDDLNKSLKSEGLLGLEISNVSYTEDKLDNHITHLLELYKSIKLKGLQALGKWGVSYITELDLPNQTKGLQAFDELLKSNAKIEHLKLNFCKINNEKKVRSLAIALLKSTSIKQVDLHGNKIGLDGIKTISTILNTKDIQVRINNQDMENIPAHERKIFQEKQMKLIENHPRLIFDNTIYKDGKYSCDYDYNARPVVENTPIIQILPNYYA